MKYLSLKLIAVFILLSAVVFAQSADTVKENKVARTSLNTAAKYFDAAETSKAFVELLKAQTLYKLSGYKKGQVYVLKAFAEYYQRNELWSQSYSYYKQALPLVELPDTSLVSAELQLGLAKVSIRMGKLDDALENAANALRQFTYKALKGRMAETYVAFASVKRANKDYRQAEMTVLETALPLLHAPAEKDKIYLIGCFDELGHIYYEQKQYTQAKWMFLQAINQSRICKDTTGIVVGLINLGEVKTDIKDYALAVKDFKEAEILARKKSLIPQQAELSNAFALVYKKMGNQAEASRYAGAYGLLKDSMVNVQKRRELAAEQAKEEAVETLIPSEKLKKQAGNANHNVAIYYLAGILVILILAGLILYFRKKK